MVKAASEVYCFKATFGTKSIAKAKDMLPVPESMPMTNLYPVWVLPVLEEEEKHCSYPPLSVVEK